MDGAVAIDVEYGPVGRGYSRAHRVMGRDGNAYFAKGQSYIRHFRHVATNELIAAGLAIQMDLPLPPHAILFKGKHLFFGSNRVGCDRHRSDVLHLYFRASNYENSERVRISLMFSRFDHCFGHPNAISLCSKTTYW